MSNLSASGAPRALDYVINSPVERKGYGISSNSAYIDTINSARMADYEKDYAEYLYNKYQSPEAYAKLLEDAGINRNFAGANSGGTISNPSGGFRSNVGELRSKNIANTLSTINAIIGAVNAGVNVVSELSGLPKDLAFKEYRNVLAAHNANIADSEEMSRLMKAMYDQSYYGGVVFPEFEMNGVNYNISQSPAMQQAFSRNALMDLKVKLANFDLNNLKPEQVRQIQENIDKLAIQSDYLGIQKDMYSTLKASGLLVPIIVSLLKFL